MKLTRALSALAAGAILAAGIPAITAPAAQAAEQSYMDGATGYVHEYAITGISKYVKPESVRNLMVNKFDVVFPFRPQGCSVPLKVGDVCTLGVPKKSPGKVPDALKDWVNGKSKVKVDHIGSDGFTFRSMPGHIEGANRLITFTAFRDGNGEMTLRVHARGPGDSPLWRSGPGTIAANFLLTKILWSDFRNRLEKQLRSSGGGSW